MLLYRVGQSLVRPFHLHAPRRWYVLSLIAVAALIFSSGKTSARWDVITGSARRDVTNGQAQTSPLPLKLLPARFAPYSPAAGMFDISATPVTTVSAASFEAPVAPEAIVSAFGLQLATQTAVGTDDNPNLPGIQLPTQLAGTTVEVNGRRAGLFFVSPSQVNFLMPAGTAAGPANVVIRSGDGIISNGTVQITRVAPAVFTANSNGSGVPAAVLVRVKANGQQIYESISQFSTAANRFIPKPIDVGASSDQLVLVLFPTGLRGADDPNGDGNLQESFRVLIGGEELTPQFVGKHPDLVGLDQLNVVIPRSLDGRGIVNVSIVATGFGTSRAVNIEIGSSGSTPSGPQVTSFSGAALAGQELLINGNGFANNVSGNGVKVNGLDMQVMEAATSQLKVMVPRGVETGTVSVTTAQGVGMSTAPLPVITSISGFVENTLRQPLSGVVVRVPNTEITATTNSDGAFVLPRAPIGSINVEVDGGSLQTQPPYPKLALKITSYASRDNQFAQNIALQQATGASGNVGSGSVAGAAADIGERAGARPPEPLTLATGGIQLNVPSNVRVEFPDGASSGRIILTPLSNSRTPVPLPFGVYSASIAQITPFKVKFDPGLKISFPNPENFPAGALVDLYRYDFDTGKFVQEKDPARVSADGQRIETAPDAIKITSYYFAAQQKQTTTITGRVLDKNGKPVSRAIASFRGQESLPTDGNGSYTLRYVPVSITDTVVVDISAPRGQGRVDRVQSASVSAVVGGITKIPDVTLPDEKENRPPTILAPPEVEVVAGTTLDVPIIVTDPDPGQKFTLTVSGANYATVISPNNQHATLHLLRLTPSTTETGNKTLTLVATDTDGAKSEQRLTVIIIRPNRPPTANNQTVMVDEDGMVNITLTATDPDRAPLTYTVVASPRNGALTGTPPNLIYKPHLNFNGSDRLDFIASSSNGDSNLATVTIIVKPINDPPILTVPGPQTIKEGQLLSFAISAADPDIGQRLTLTATGLPENALLTQVTPTSWQFTWIPDLTQAGNYVITFKVTDDGNPPLSDTKEVRITVNDTALITVPGTQIVSEGQALSFSVVSTQGPGQVTITAVDLPAGAQFTNVSPTAGQFRWTPSTSQSGNYLIRFRATLTDSPQLSETRQVPITVFDVVRELAKESAPFNVYGARGNLQQGGRLDEGDALGTSVATGDLNGDGIPDLAIGAPTANGGGTNTGKVYVFFGKAGLPGTVDLSRERADVEISGADNEDRFGTSLVIADVNGDGKDDLISGAPFADVGDRTDAGKAYVFPGPLAHGAYPLDRLTPLVIMGAATNDRFGTSLAAGRLRTKNGPADLIVGAPGFDAPAATTSLLDAGAVFVFFGSSTPAPMIDLAGTAPSYTILGAAANAQIGLVLATGKFNGDDLDDLVIGAPRASSNNLSGNGAVYLIFGAANKAGVKGVTQEANFSMNGAQAGSGFGTAVALGDLDGDGLADLIIGAPGDSLNNTRPGIGSVIVILGGTGAINRPVMTVLGAGATNDAFGDALGTSLATGDFNGDGITDLAIGAPGADAEDSTRDPAGVVYLINGVRGGLPASFDLARQTADYTVYGADPGDRLGSGGMILTNLNAVEPQDLVLGTPQARSLNNSRPNAGEVRVLFGFKR